MRSGHTLFELAAALLLISLGSATLLPLVSGARDRYAVVAGREALAGLFAVTRSEAVARGGATVRLQGDPWRGWVEAGDTVLPTVAVERDLGVALELPRGRRDVQVRFDATGLGQVASLTVVIRKGRAEASLVVSGYGRVRRR